VPVPRSSRRYDNSVFLNCPYDQQFKDLFLAYIVGICSFGLTPRTTLEIVGGEQRLRRITMLIQSCRLSFHDLSRVEIDHHDPLTPRFNMPFEAGLAVMYSLLKEAPRHTYFIFEQDSKRLQKSLSDLGGSDVFAHGGTVHGVFREIGNALVAAKRRPTVKEMYQVFEQVSTGLGSIMHNAGETKPYSARVFSDLVVLANELVKQKMIHRQSGL
jgi:hypothetical protein